MMSRRLSTEFADHLKALRRGRKLHSTVATRLKELLAQVSPESPAVPEVVGVLGGRNDLMQFAFNGRRIVFEIFATASQVPQDLRLLEQAKADVRVAVLLDPDVDPRVAEEYFHKKPDHFPFVWVSDVLRPDWERICVAELSELLDENSLIRVVRRILAKPGGRSLTEPLRSELTKVEAQLHPPAKLDSKKMTGYQLLALSIAGRLLKLGVGPDRLRSLYAWLEKALDYGLEVAACGFAPILVTDLSGHHGIWSSGDAADILLLGEGVDHPVVVLSLREPINTFLEALGVGRKELRFHFTHTYAEFLNPAEEPSSSNQDST